MRIIPHPDEDAMNEPRYDVTAVLRQGQARNVECVPRIHSPVPAQHHAVRARTPSPPRPLLLVSGRPRTSLAVLAAGSFNYPPRLAAVAAELGLADPHLLSERDRCRLIDAIFDPRVAPTSVERAR